MWNNLWWMINGATLLAVVQFFYIKWKYGSVRHMVFRDNQIILHKVSGTDAGKRKITVCEPCADRIWNTMCEYKETAEDEED